MFLALVVFCYVRGWLHLRSAFPRIINLRQMAAFIGGLFAIWVAAGSPLAVMDHELLSIHMVQHLLLMAVAPPLILLGAPIPALLHGLPQELVQAIIGPLRRSISMRRIATCIGHPIFCWFAGTMTVIAWHLPALFALGLHSALWHETESASFLMAGLLFWWPVLQPWPSASRISQWSVPLYLFLATLPCDALSAFLTFCGRVIYPSYLSAPHLFPISALQDQEWAGVLMWVSVTFLYMLPALLLTVRMLTPSDSESVTLGPKSFSISSVPPRRVGE
jgi:cytochrome c oxidase assembly factor CtaG